MIKKLIFLLVTVNTFYLSYGQSDTIYIREDQILLIEDSIIAPSEDTIFILEPDTKFKIRKNPYASSQEFYSKLKEKTSGNRVTRKLSNLFIVDTDKQSEDLAESGKSSHEIYQQFQGMVIKNIYFKHVDILEGSVLDTSRNASSNLAVMANKYHVNTKDWVLRSNLTIAPGQLIDAYTLSDNERLLRRLPYLEDAKIYVQRTTYLDEADVIIAVKDRIEWGFRGTYSTSNQLELEAYNRSVAGLGRYAALSYYHHNEYSPHNGYNFQIGGQNSLKAITSWSINRSNYWDKKDFGIQAQKAFVTPSVKYGGGIEYRVISDTTISLDGDTEEGDFYKLDYWDVWLGRSFLLRKGDDRKNITVSARIRDNHFQNQPEVTRDSSEIYFNRTLALGQVAYTKQKFIKSSYITGFGISEDIPIGYRVSLLIGRDYNEFYTQNYLGINYFFARYFNKVGYILTNSQLGGFSKHALKTGVLGFRVAYFSPLFELGGYKNRNYINIGYTNGIRQPMSRTLSLSSRIRDINGDGILGENAFYIKLESSLYTPWYFYGFRFAPFFYVSYSDITDNRSLFEITQNHYQSTGLGIRIKNESLVFNTFEIRVTRFWAARDNTDPFIINIGVSAPITFENIFSYKPQLIPFE